MHDEPAEQPIEVSPRRRHTHRILIGSGLVIGLILACVSVVYFISRAPQAFPLQTAVTIVPGLSAGEVADQLADQEVVRSSDVLFFLILAFHDPADIKAGAYVFDQPQSVFEIARRITDDKPEFVDVILTFPEGITVEAYADIATKHLTSFDRDVFIAEAVKHEGFLFPDTYYVPPTFSAPALISLLQETYTERTEGLFQDEEMLTEYEIITLASLLEREANSKESMRMVAGILRTRLAMDMPLQADASLEYVLDKPLEELTPEDLKLDSPYNTYTNRGLPPTPIGNPGLEAIMAALDPMESDYLYYLTDADGTFHYAKTYEEHQQNIERYLR